MAELSRRAVRGMAMPNRYIDTLYEESVSGEEEDEEDEEEMSPGLMFIGSSFASGTFPSLCSGYFMRVGGTRAWEDAQEGEYPDAEERDVEGRDEPAMSVWSVVITSTSGAIG